MKPILKFLTALLLAPLVALRATMLHLLGIGFVAKTAGRYRVRFSARAVKDWGD